MEMLCDGCRRSFERPPNRKQMERSFCSSKCYGKWQRGRSFADQGKPVRPVRFCEIPSCDRIYFGRGKCRHHYLEAYIRKNAKVVKPRVDLTCLNCGSAFQVPHFRKDAAKFCTRQCAARYNRTGKIIKKGYRKVLLPDHPRADGKGYVFEHIVTAEKMLNRPIHRGEEVHHRDGNRLNNAPANLEVFPNHAAHMLKHGHCVRLSNGSRLAEDGPASP